MKRIWLFALLASGCGSGYLQTPAPVTPPTPGPQDHILNGRNDIFLTSTNGNDSTSIFTNFTRTGTTTFTGAANSVVCPKDLSQCVGDDSPVVSIIPSGTVNGVDVTITITFPGVAGEDTVTMVGAETGPGDISGTYTDSLGDAGTFIAFPSGVFLGGSGTHSGTFNSTPNPLAIAPTILFTFTELRDAGFHLTGTATIMNSPCISSLTLSGEEVGDAVKLTDQAAKAHILILPGAIDLAFSYSFEPDAPSCAGDFGLGMTTDPNPWE